MEMMIGAILTQNTAWKNVERAIENLKDRRLLSLEELHALSPGELARHIRPAGYYNVKAKRIKNFVGHVMEHYGGDLEALLSDSSDSLRESLLSVKGIGPETADSILLYAAHLPVFVVDAYTHRILVRHGMVDEGAGYQELQALFMDHLPDDHRLFNDLHALIVRTGKEYCRKKPLCEHCPLEDWGPQNPRRESTAVAV